MDKDLKYSKLSETDQVFRSLDSLNQTAETTATGLSATSERSVLTMSSLGKLGRFGNQLFQYAFLRICALKSNAQIECPGWIGQPLFGHTDPPITQRLPAAIEQLDQGETLFDAFPEFIPYIEKWQAHQVFELELRR